ncbi:MAG: hydrogenase maturation nickel metallochaperone HypA [Candidatus Omnitrophota bacterium]
MHEIGLVDDIVRTIKDRLKALKDSKVKVVNICIGELEHVTVEHFKFHFMERIKGTLLEEATLNFKKIEARFKCGNCENEFSAEEGIAGCPRCASKVNDIISGSGVYVESIEVSEVKA